MRKLISGLFLLACVAVPGSAQSGEGYRGQGQVFFAPGRGLDTTTLHVGAGGEGFVYRGLAAGGEIGYLFPAQSFVYGAGILSVNGSYHLNRRSNWVVSPFVTGGYSLAFRGDRVNLANFGGGLNYWLGKRTGLRLEVRDYIAPGYDTTHFVEFRIGLAFR